jgi:hypothetical protein
MPFIETYPEPALTPSVATAMGVTFDLLPAGWEVDLEVWVLKVTVDGVEVDVMPGASVDDSEVSRTASFTLADISEAGLFTPAAMIDVIVQSPDGSKSYVEIEDGRVRSLSTRLAGEPGAEDDTVRVTVESRADTLLAKTSDAGTVIYDSDRVTLSAADYKVITDGEGNEYVPELVGVPGLKLADLLDLVLIDRCGLTQVETNLPVDEWPIEQYRVQMGQRFYDGLKGLWGMYSPVVKLDGTEVGIYDSTLPLPAGVPAPRAVTVDEAEELQTEHSRQAVDGLMVQFAGVENNYDFTTPRFEYPSEAHGSSTIDYERIVIEFRKITTPGNSVKVREELNIENKTTSIDGVTVEDSSEQFLFSSRGEIAVRTKRTRALLPTLPLAVPGMRTSRDEREQFSYQAHPFKRRSTYCSRRATTIHGLVVNDSDNPNIYDEPARQEVNVALRSNNIAAGQIYSTEPVSTRIETAIPQKDGTVLTRVLVTDDVNPSNSVDYFERRPGDIGVSGLAATEEAIPVFPTDGHVRDGSERMDYFHIGELPLKFGLPLARRVLLFRRTKGRTADVRHVGYDPTLQQAVPFSPYDRAGTLIGSFLTEGRRVVFDRGVTIELRGREMAASAESLQRLGPMTASLEAGDSVTWELPVECATGVELTVSPASVANITIEARHVELPPLAWTDLEGGVIDLSPWDGLTEDFEFRFTAGAVAVPTRVTFSIVTRAA